MMNINKNFLNNQNYVIDNKLRLFAKKAVANVLWIRFGNIFNKVNKKYKLKCCIIRWGFFEILWYIWIASWIYLFVEWFNILTWKYKTWEFIILIFLSIVGFYLIYVNLSKYFVKEFLMKHIDVFKQPKAFIYKVFDNVIVFGYKQVAKTFDVIYLQLYDFYEFIFYKVYKNKKSKDNSSLIPFENINLIKYGMKKAFLWTIVLMLLFYIFLQLYIYFFQVKFVDNLWSMFYINIFLWIFLIIFFVILFYNKIRFLYNFFLQKKFDSKDIEYIRNNFKYFIEYNGIDIFVAVLSFLIGILLLKNQLNYRFKMLVY